jgi:hypothetical protein
MKPSVTGERHFNDWRDGLSDWDKYQSLGGSGGQRTLVEMATHLLTRQFVLPLECAF